ncbi:MAG: helix-turn-helix transcriptional regulator [Acidobacteria bacterium]|nr:helix-turn-helix transcriptional regulator [Acidobacteriota bacterium]MBK8147913.1 helix-turn-helix transcriptional regulator [Acidobacteriota bacterium]MBK8813482.1 helix-turn-helix transcriptional regulator [Acidobacteriota bacterium]
MNYFRAGQFFGKTDTTRIIGGVTATETEYDYRYVDWHHHENPYFSFVVAGNCRHINRRRSYDCSPDSLLFHNCHESHRNSRTGGISKGFQIELSQDWCGRYEIRLDRLADSVLIDRPDSRILFYNVLKEFKFGDNASATTIDSLLVRIFGAIAPNETRVDRSVPRWVAKMDEILHAFPEKEFSLLELARELNVHFAHISRDFGRYFGCNFSRYVRKIKVERSLGLLRRSELSLIDIAYMSGFSDQSHFIRCFREFNGLTPKEFRRLLA